MVAIRPMPLGRVAGPGLKAASAAISSEKLDCCRRLGGGAVVDDDDAGAFAETCVEFAMVVSEVWICSMVDTSGGGLANGFGTDNGS